VRVPFRSAGIKTLIVLLVIVGATVALFFARTVLGRTVKHAPVEYYSGWGGYADPITLQHKITKEEADAIAARGNAYLIGYFNADNRAERIVKMLHGKVFFECLYDYYPTGRLKRAQITNPDGIVTVRHYDERGRRQRKP
jgi:hypothetical protein